jgi:hypothetical protein
VSGTCSKCCLGNSTENPAMFLLSHPVECWCRQWHSINDRSSSPSCANRNMLDGVIGKRLGRCGYLGQKSANSAHVKKGLGADHQANPGTDGNGPHRRRNSCASWHLYSRAHWQCASWIRLRPRAGARDNQQTRIEALTRFLPDAGACHVTAAAARKFKSIR